jgi:hypothetical protein
MPEKETLERAHKDAREGKSPSTQAGEFIREEVHHVREGKHGARSTRQLIAIGLSKARRAGVKLAAPAKGKASAEVRHRAQKDLEKGRGTNSNRRPSPKRSRATKRVLEREGHEAASTGAVGQQAKASARRRGAADRHRAAVQAIKTKGAKGLGRAGRKAARTRAKA